MFFSFDHIYQKHCILPDKYKFQGIWTLLYIFSVAKGLILPKWILEVALQLKYKKGLFLLKFGTKEMLFAPTGALLESSRSKNYRATLYPPLKLIILPSFKLR